MPLLIDGGRIPAGWAEKEGWRAGLSADSRDTRAECIKIALINNMPDAALEDTELQFLELLNTAAEESPVLLKLFSLPKVPRSDRGQEHLNSFYFGIEDLLSSRFDGVIITGTEPRHPDLRKEPYWSQLADVFDWAEENSTSTVLSCLAAHAGVLHSDGIGRHALDDKQFGVFDDGRVSDHVLTSGTSEPMRFPHSRWNEVREDALTSCGYSVLTKSAEAGVNLFVKKKRKSLFVHFQGHPEYGAGTLWKEYRRDIRRFLRRERPTYPKMPHGYFGPTATKLLDEFRKTALSHPREELLAELPEVAMGDGLQSAWHSAATRVYSNWLQYVVAKRASTAVYAASAPSRISVTWSR
jgi:homoserine O-succinyltransferase